MRIIASLLILLVSTPAFASNYYESYRDYHKKDSYYDRLINDNLGKWPKASVKWKNDHWWGYDQLKDDVHLLRVKFPQKLYLAYKIDGNQGWFCELGHQNGFPNCKEFSSWFSVHKKDSTVTVEQAIYLANKDRIHDAIQMIEDLMEAGLDRKSAIIAAQYTVRDLGINF